MNLWEIAVILLVALVVLKPEQFPEIAKTAGYCLGKLKNFWQQLLDSSNVL